MASPLILPGTLEFFLASQEIPPPPGWEQFAAETGGAMGLIARPGNGGLLEAVPIAEFEEYLYGGEADLRQEELDAIEEQEQRIFL